MNKKMSVDLSTRRFLGRMFGDLVFKHVDPDFDITRKILLNKELNSNEKGLLLIVLSFPENIDSPLGINRLMNASGQDLEFYGTLDSLEKKGYLKREKLFNENEKKVFAVHFHFYFKACRVLVKKNKTKEMKKMGKHIDNKKCFVR